MSKLSFTVDEVNSLLSWVSQNQNSLTPGSKFAVKTANYTIVDEDWILGDGTFIITMPAPGTRINGSNTSPIVITNKGTGDITLSPNGAEDLPLTTLLPDESISFATDGTDWYIFN